MDNNNKNSLQGNQLLAAEELARTSYEYSYPINDGDESESNKSTPYFTPLEFFQSSFEFPSPTLDKTAQYKTSDISSSSPALVTSKSTINIGYETPPTSAVECPSCYSETKKSATPTQKTFAAVNPKQLQTASSPALHRKLRRFSLYERRSCSPQHLLLKNTSSASVDSNERLLEQTAVDFVDDKENTKPRTVVERSSRDDNMQSLLKSGNNSPITLIEDSPNIIAGAGENRLPYSPKLLASLNFLNLGGSPLGLISSAGYKNGNYFKFPEVDHHAVQDANIVPISTNQETTTEESSIGQCDNHLRNRQKSTVGLRYDTSPALPTTHHKVRLKSDLETAKCSHITDHQKDLSNLEDDVKSSTSAVDCKKNRKNKNNLTIKISDTNSSQFTLPSPSPKPKTPTIKSTKEKALSLDSAANVSELSIAIASSRDQAHVSYDHIDSQLLKTSNDHLGLGQTNRSVNVGGNDKFKPSLFLRGSSPATNRSTSLSQLASLSSTDVAANHLYAGSFSIFNKPGGNLVKTPRRKVLTTSNNEWLHYHRKQNPFNLRSDNATLNQNISSDSNKRSAAPVTESNEKIYLDLNESVVLKEDDETTHTEDGSPIYLKHIPSSSNNTTILTPVTPLSSLSTPHRGLHKHNPLLHSSSTNLKTLPEFLTLVEFTHKDSEHPYKQKSFDLPSSSSTAVPSTSAHLPTIRTKSITSNSSTNLLQRRGSNHSLTLNLHGSCSNLLGSCRSGLSISNYSLGSAANSTTNLNSKSSYNLDLSATTSNAPTLNIINPGQTTTSQGIKQSLFRRRGSNNSLTLNNLSATSCGNLKLFCSQNSLNSEHGGSHLLQPTAGGVTRTTSFVTSTKNTASNSAAPKRGLLERRGSNQSLTLNMSGTLGERSNNLAVGSNYYLGDTGTTTDNANAKFNSQSDCNQPTSSTSKYAKNLLPVSCAQSHQRKFFSSENLTKANTQFSDLNQAHKRNSQQVCYGSVSDLKPSDRDASNAPFAENRSIDRPNFSLSSLSRSDQIDFQDSTVCTCTGVRNITTRPLSPQTTSEEFKVYLANIQMLQNATNALNQFDLIKLNYIFDNSYALASSKSYVEQSISMLNTVGAGMVSKGGLSSDSPPPSGPMSTSEDCEIAARYQEAVNDILSSIKLEDEDQKRMFRELHKEFWDLPLNHQEKPMVFGSQAKNRYKTILPNENSRLILDNEWTHQRNITDRNDTGTIKNPHEMLTTNSTRHFVVTEEAPYINANYIKGPDFTSKCYIATQGPLPNTIFEFWLMIYQNTHKHFEQSQLSTNLPLYGTDGKMEQHYQKIVMLTNFLECHRQKCSIYFPVELNEIFISTVDQESLTPTKEISDFFQEYLTSNTYEDDIQHALINVNKINDTKITSIETKRIKVPTKLHKTLLNNTNFFVIKNIGIVKKNGFSIRKFCILYCIDSFETAPTNTVDDDADKTHQQEQNKPLLIRKFYCYHYWYPDWPDHRSPKDINTLLDICLHILNIGKCEQEFESFCDDVQETQQEAQHIDQYQQDIFNDIQPLPVIHCSAGIGRTGCMAAILNGVRQLRQSLAYSLISMAAAAVPKNDVELQNLSPIDFRLPKQYLAQAEANCINDQTADTDSSFTRNTLLYVNYILHKNNSTDCELLERRNKLPILNELPKMPDIYVDVLGIVCNLRLQRGGMVQNSEQYELIHRALCLYLKRTFALKRF